MPIWTAVLVSSLLFGIVHLMVGGIWLTIGAALMGACFGVIFVKTKSLYVAITAHTFTNLPDFIMPYLPELSAVTRNLTAFIFAAISGIMLVLFCKKKTAYNITER